METVNMPVSLPVAAAYRQLAERHGRDLDQLPRVILSGSRLNKRADRQHEIGACWRKIEMSSAVQS
jgi:hypothetical protein